MNTDAKFDWMREAIYEPAPLPRRTFRLHPIIWLAAIAIVSGALVALEPIYEAVK